MLKWKESQARLGEKGTIEKRSMRTSLPGRPNPLQVTQRKKHSSRRTQIQRSDHTVGFAHKPLELRIQPVSREWRNFPFQSPAGRAEAERPRPAKNPQAYRSAGGAGPGAPAVQAYRKRRDKEPTAFSSPCSSPSSPSLQNADIRVWTVYKVESSTVHVRSRLCED